MCTALVQVVRYNVAFNKAIRRFTFLNAESLKAKCKYIVKHNFCIITQMLANYTEEYVTGTVYVHICYIMEILRSS